ncbi:MAG: hypothetical protein DRJ64_01190 [Thermoprotei archaeon]|nr:MAG: hypothetical protein DRJ64_01190 [Thermoprotei archaeon]
MIHPYKLAIEGFGNIIGPLKIRFRGQGVRVIKAKNGTGKTTILSSIAWVLYGKPLKNGSTVETWEHKRPQNYLGTKVSFKFKKHGVKYQVIRCKDYRGTVLGRVGKNHLMLVIDGEEYTEYQNKRDLQKKLELIMGQNYELFTNTVIFPQKITRFIELKGAQRKEILEEVFDISFITQGYELANNKLKELAEQGHTISKKIVELESSIWNKEHSVELLEKIDSEIADKVLMLRTKVTGLETELLELTHSKPRTAEKVTIKIANIRNSEIFQQLSTKMHNLTVQEQYLTDRVSDRKKLEKKIKKAKYSDKEDVSCEVCGQTLDTKASKKVLDKLLSDLVIVEKKASTLSTAVTKLKIDTQSGSAMLQEVCSLEEQKKNIKNKLATWEKGDRAKAIVEVKIESLQEEIKRVLDTDNSEAIQVYKDEAEELEETLDKEEVLNRKNIKQQDIYKFLAQKVFSKNGFKAFLLDMAIKDINTILSKYADQTGFLVELEIADNAYRDVQAIIYVDDYPVIYQDLSGGESKMINASISLSLAEFMGNRGSMNLLALDEITENLDSENQERVGNIISTIGEEKDVWIITHSPYLVIPNAEIVHLDSEEGVINKLYI